MDSEIARAYSNAILLAGKDDVDLLVEISKKFLTSWDRIESEVAVSAAEGALHFRSSPDLNLMLAKALDWKAVLHVTSADEKQKLLQRAERVARQALSASKQPTAEMSFTLGDILLDRESYAEADNILRSALDLNRANPDADRQASILRDLIKADDNLKRPSEVDKWFDSLVQTGSAQRWGLATTGGSVGSGKAVCGRRGKLATGGDFGAINVELVVRGRRIVSVRRWQGRFGPIRCSKMYFRRFRQGKVRNTTSQRSSRDRRCAQSAWSVRRKPSWRFESLGRDLRYGMRGLWRNPGFTVIALLTLALAIGANSTVFSLLSQALMRALPVQDPEQLVVFSFSGGAPGHTQSEGGNTPGHHHEFSYPMYRDLRDKNTVLSGLIATAPISVGVVWKDHAEAVSGEMVSGNYFETLGVKPGARPATVGVCGSGRRSWGRG